MDVRKERNAEIHEVIAESGLRLSRALQCDGERRGRRHGADCGHIGGAVVLQNVQAVPTGVDARDAVEQGQPEIVADHHNHNDNQENRKLLCDAALIGEGAEGRAD